MNGFAKRMERIAAALKERQSNLTTVFFKDGRRETMAFFEVLELVCSCASTLDHVECGPGTGSTASLINAMLGDEQDMSEQFDDIPEAFNA